MLDISILIIGSGSIGKRHAKNLLNLVREVKVYSLRFSKNEYIEKIKKVVYVKNLYQEIELADGIVIANRTDKHLEIAKFAIKRNKHVFIEKPISHNMLGIREIENFEKASSGNIESGFMLRFHPNLIFLKNILSKKKYGHIHYVRSSVGQNLLEWRENYDHKKGYAAKREWGGGVTLDLIHEIDLVRWLFGEVKMVSAMFGNSPELEIETESIAHLNLKMEEEFLVQLSLDYVRPYYGRNSEIVCSKGILIWDYEKGTINLQNKKGEISVLHKVNKDFTRNSMFIDEITHFLNSINGLNENKASNLNDAIKALKICCAAHLSNKEKQFVYPCKITYDYEIK